MLCDCAFKGSINDINQCGCFNTCAEDSIYQLPNLSDNLYVDTSIYQCETNELVISAAVMDVVLAVSENSQMILDNWRAILDTCATVTLIPTNCAECLGLPIMPHTDGRRVGTADQHGNFTIQGWVELPALYQSVTDISHPK